MAGMAVVIAFILLVYAFPTLMKIGCVVPIVAFVVGSTVWLMGGMIGIIPMSANSYFVCIGLASIGSILWVFDL